MELTPMRYGDFVWPHNPRTYEIEYSRRIVSHKVPFGLYTLSDMGRDRRILKGEGEFVGENAYKEFKSLASMFYVAEPRILVHPVWQSAPAWLVSLRLRQEPRKDFVSYAFEFWECYDGYELGVRAVEENSAPSEKMSSSTEKKSYALKRGDTLWGLAQSNGLSLSQLLALNPQIKNPNIYYVGDVVYLS